MAIAISETDLESMPILWQDSEGQYRLVQSDERNLEILEYKHIGGEGKRGRKGIERDSWVSIPCYCSTLELAFSKIIDIKAKNQLKRSKEVEQFKTHLNEVKVDFLNQLKGGK